MLSFSYIWKSSRIFFTCPKLTFAKFYINNVLIFYNGAYIFAYIAYLSKFRSLNPQKGRIS